MKNTNDQSANKTPRKSRNSFAILLITLLVIAAIMAIYFYMKPSVKKPIASQSQTEFNKEGEFYFLSDASKDTIKKIDIEIADNSRDQQLGLMYRNYLPEDAGMLFIFEKDQPQSFWMRNTAISLDILFINSKKEIVTIQKYAVPYTDNAIPSYKDAKYVLEVNAGFVDKYNIKEGSLIDFQQFVNH